MSILERESGPFKKGAYCTLEETLDQVYHCFRVHDYFRIDLDEVWLVVQNDIPTLKNQVQAILEELEGRPDAEL